MTKDTYKNIKGYEGRYQINKLGKVKSLSRLVKNNASGGKRLLKETILKPKVKANKYLEVNLRDKMQYVHRLVAQTFIGEIPSGYSVNHKDGDKSNNNLDNLEIVTFSRNSKHAYEIGLSKPSPSSGEKHGMSKLKMVDVLTIREMYSKEKNIVKITKKYPFVHRSTILKIIYNKTWV